MPLGIVGKMMNTRMNGGVNALLDSWIRKVDPDARRAASIIRTTPGTATNPSNPWWKWRLRRRPVRHAFLQAEHQLGQELRREQDAGSALEARSIERGARIVVITPEYNPTAYRADYWIPVRPNPMRRFSSAPARSSSMRTGHRLHQAVHGQSPLVRTDTLQYLDPRDVKDFKFPISPRAIRAA